MNRSIATTLLSFAALAIAACAQPAKTDAAAKPAAETTPAVETKKIEKPAATAPEAKQAEKPATPAPAPAAPAATPAAPTTPAAPAAPTTPAAPTADAKVAFVKMTTNKGDIIIELDRVKAPISTENFLKYVNKGQYNGTVFHRVIKDFMIQGGGFDGTLTEKSTDAPIKNECTNGLSNARGTIAMARTNDPNSATAQFYINTVDNKMLDGRPGRPGYAVFGKVVDGMNTVDAIRAVKTGQKMANSRGGQGPMGDVPMETVEIIKVVEIPAPAMAPAAPAAK
jgi:cyclophilin family peptidyl-prolyl cis-trans isomerase